MAAKLRALGYEPVWKDWDPALSEHQSGPAVPDGDQCQPCVPHGETELMAARDALPTAVPEARPTLSKP